MKNLDTAFSPCPNDTFIFHAMIHGLCDTGAYSFQPFVTDVEALNREAFRERFALTKLSFHAYYLLKDKYTLLNSGAALGYGCGPLLISKSSIGDFRGIRVAIPGEHTTAHLLLRLWNPDIQNIRSVRFDGIIPGILSGEFDAGVLIHEGRFVYQRHNLAQIIDLGEWWEKETNLPVPLGCIALRKRDSDERALREIAGILRASVEHALNDRTGAEQYVKAHASELDDEVIQQHIALYVNEFTVELGATGERAVNTLEEMARWKGILSA